MAVRDELKDSGSSKRAERRPWRPRLDGPAETESDSGVPDGLLTRPLLSDAMVMGDPRQVGPAVRVEGRPSGTLGATLVGRTALLPLALVTVFAVAGCAGILGIDFPIGVTDASAEGGPDSSSSDGTDASTADEPDASSQDATTDAAGDAVSDAHEGGAATDQACGVCVPGATEACGVNGTQTCSAQCKWGTCSVSNTIGCSDGSRDGFVSATSYPKITGCLGDWNEGSMRAPKTGVPCGKDTGVRCAVPADLCSEGWHVCGTPPYGPTDISAKMTNAQCTAETTGSFLAALGDLECDPCSATGFGAVCCGSTCIQQNGSCVWANATPWVGEVGTHTNLCSDVYNTYPTVWGALCCMD